MRDTSVNIESAGPGPPPPLMLITRAFKVCGTLAAGGVRLITVVGAGTLRPGPAPPRQELAAAVGTDVLVKLGPAFIKVGQLLSTRVDLLPRAVCRALARLHDRLPGPPRPRPESALPRPLSALLDRRAGVTLVAAGSIACVYHARLRDGRSVAVKVRRPAIETTVACDLHLLRIAAGLAQRLPGLRGAPLADLMAQVAEAVWQQLDLVREAAALRSLRGNLAELEGVRIPEVFDELSSRDVLVMEFLDGLRSGGGEPTPERSRRIGLVNGLRAAFHMLFLDGLVHCDLHPGNLYPMGDGTAVILDAGFTRRLPDRERRLFASFFYQMIRGNGAACADIVCSTARSGAGSDRAAFREGLTRLVEGHSRVSIADFDLVRFTVRLFALQREHGFYADASFVFPILSLLVLEGTLREQCEDLDFQTEALPFVLRGLMR